MSSRAPTAEGLNSGSPAQAVPNAALRDTDPALVLADRVEQLYSQLWVGILGTFAVGAIATFELWDRRMQELVLFWWGLVLVLTAASSALLFSYRRSTDKVEQAERWLRWFGLAALANGANWGFAGAVFFPSHTDAQQVFLAFLLSGVVAGGIPVYAGSWPVYAIYAAGVLAPFAYVLSTFGNRLFVELALLVPVYYMLNVAIAYRLSQVFESGYRLRHAYRKLTDDYSMLNRRLQQQLVELDDARQQVEASGRKLALFAERAPIAVLELDVDAKVRSINPAAENLFGIAASELVGAPVESVVVADEREGFRAQWKTLIEKRTPLLGMMIRNERRDGLDLMCEWTVTPLVNPEGGIVSVIAQGRDMTRQLEAEKLKKEFTSTLSHELRTPLTSIIGSLQLVNSGVFGEVEKDITDLTVIAERNAERLLDLINDLLDIDKIESGKFTLTPETLALDELLREAMELNRAFAERHEVRFEALGTLQPAPVYVDRKRLLQILTNLMSNAAKFSPTNAAVEIETLERDGRIRVNVHDRGSGIPEGFRSRIFSRFAQADSTTSRQKGGTGLGLAICKHLVELMHGEIGFDDRPGGGTTFWFELPKHQS